MFYIVVVLVAVTVLILFLTFMGLLLRNQGSNEIFPPQSNNCPDYWTSDDKGKCFKPTVKSFSTSDPAAILNVGGLTTLPLKSAPYSTDGISFDTKDPLWSSNGQSAICAQKSWSNNNGIMWDSISNFNKC